jgi:amino acid adenylation domain-containing protein
MPSPLEPDKDSRRQRVAGLSEEKRAYLARLLRQKGSDTPLPILPRRRTSNVLPVSYAQQRLWFLHQLEPASPAYNILTPWRLSEPLDLRALVRSLAEIVCRHEVLRTSFTVIDGQPFQVVAPAQAMALPVVDLRALPAAVLQAEASRLATQEARRPFDLARGPLLRATLLRLEGPTLVLWLALHHIVTDGWSTTVLTRELAALYAAFMAGRPSPLVAPPIQYADFALWQREWLRGEALASQMAYWKRQLADLPQLALPTDRRRPPLPSFRGRREPVGLGAALGDALKALSQRAGATLFMTLLAAFQTLLCRYSGQTDIAVGSPTANRTRTELEGLIGFFVNTLVLRTDLSGDPSFGTALERSRAVALAAYAHQEVPFEKLVEELQPERDPSRNPLFQVTFQQLQSGAGESGGIRAKGAAAPAAGFKGGGESSRLFEVDTGTAPFDLAFDLGEGPAGLAGGLEYSTDLFDRDTIVRLAGHFATLLLGIVADPGARLSELPLLTAEEREQLRAWNGTAAESSPRACVHELVAAQAARAPDAPAVVSAAGTLTYGELDRRANRVARRLRSLGVGPETLVGVCLERSPAWVIGLLGVLKAGGAYVPLDPSHPPDRLAFLLADTRAGTVVTERRCLPRLPALPGRILCLDDPADDPILGGESEVPLAGGVAPDHRAYVLYTSGSTGQPKGVEVRHDGLARLVAWHLRTYALTPADRAAQVASPAFDASVWETWVCLAAGASLDVLDDETRASPAGLVAWLAGRGITTCFLPTPLAEAVLDEPWPAQAALRVLLTGGDRLSGKARQARPFRLVNHYGPTEATVVATAAEVALPGDADVPPPIGGPVSHTRAYVLDRYGRQAPAGVPGELYLAGGGLARGYLGRPDLTAERFVPDPRSGEPGARLYRTGDLVCRRADGNLHFLGRLDGQVKVRGVRIEPAEIEAALSRHPAVRESVVIARGETAVERSLVAYVVLKEPAPALGELRRFLRQQLPDAMVPADWVPLAALPLTGNGKVDRRRLPAPVRAGPETAFAAPRDGVEELLAGLWSELLGVMNVGSIGPWDDFFAMGGHSLLATRLVSRIRDTFEVELPLRRVFDTPVLRDLAAVIRETRRHSGERPPSMMPPLLPIPRHRHRAWLSAGGELEIPDSLKSLCFGEWADPGPGPGTVLEER